MLRRRHEERFDIGQQVAVHAGHLELVLEVGYGPQSPHDDAPVLFTHEILQQPGETADADIRVMAQDFARNFDALVDREEGFLGAAVRNADDHTVKQAGGTPHQILVATGEGIERSGIDGSDHFCIAAI